MTGYVGVTDFGWYSFLVKQEDLGEINFWRPMGTRPFKVLQSGQPFFLKLKAAHGHAIAGFGFFHRFETMRVQEAWELFGPANGASQLGAMWHQISNILIGHDRQARLSHHDIGCILLLAPVFFPREHWVRGPSDWKGNIVTGKGYDLTQGEGRRIWEDCQRTARNLRVSEDTRTNLDIFTEAPRYGAPRLVRPRLGQGTFRLAVRDAYGRCAVTGEHSRPVLDAAHIKPYAEQGPHQTNNGLLLRADIHRLFDAGYVTVTPDLRFKVSRKLEDEFNNGKIYYALEDRKIHLPEEPQDHPSKAFLEYHNDVVFAA